MSKLPAKTSNGDGGDRGEYPFRSWCSNTAVSTNAPLLINVNRPKVASFLKAQSYKTSIIGEWHLGYGEEEGFADNRGNAPSNHWKPRDPRIGRSARKLLETLDRRELPDITIAIFSSDNGASGRKTNRHSENGRLRGGKDDLGEHGHREPFIVRWPGRIKPGIESTVLVSQSDLFTTFAAIIGPDLPKGAAPDRDNVLPALQGEQLPNPQRSVIMSRGGIGARSIRSDKWKLMLGQGDRGYREFFGKKPHPARKLGDPPTQLYDVVADPAEKQNQCAKHPEVDHRLMPAWQKIQAKEGDNPGTPEQPKEKKQLTIQHLNALLREESK